MQIWEKFNPRERMTAAGAGIVILAWLVGIVARGFGVGSIALIGAIAVLVILYLKYAPNQNIAWPIATSLLILGISVIVAVAALLTLLDLLPFISVLGASAIISLLLYVIGAAVMAWGAWQEYQIDKPAMPNFSAGSSSARPPAPPPPASAPPAYPPGAPPASAPPAYPPASAPPASAPPAYPPSAPTTTPDDTEGAPPA
jgi:hypothetical protein